MILMKYGLLSFLATLAAFSLGLVAHAEEAEEVELEVRGMT
jgi:hypothetical protein